MPDKPITVTYPDGATASAVVDLVIRKRPVGWGRKSYATYYRKEYAMQVKRELDNMIETGKAKAFRLSSMPNLNMNTVYLWINQSFHWLMDNDPDKQKYIDLWNKIRIERVKGVAVTIKFRDFVNDVLHGEDFVAREDKVKWKVKIDEWLSDEDNIKPLHIDKLVLTDKDMAQLKSEMDELSNIQYSITSKEIKLIKTL